MTKEKIITEFLYHFCYGGKLDNRIKLNELKKALEQYADDILALQSAPVTQKIEDRSHLIHWNDEEDEEDTPLTGEVKTARELLLKFEIYTHNYIHTSEIAERVVDAFLKEHAQFKAELPTNEEIERHAKEIHNPPRTYGFIEGAKWMRSLITKQSK